MKSKFHLAGGLLLLGCATFLVFRGSDRSGSDGDARREVAAAKAGDRREKAPGQEVRSLHRGKERASLDRGELLGVLNAALDSEADGGIADFVLRQAGGDFSKVMAEVRSGADLGPRKLQMEEALLRSWSANDPDAALHWARNLPEWERAETFDRVCRNAAARAPHKAMRALLDDGEDAIGGAENIADSWAIRDPEGLIRWARNLPGGELRDRMFAKASESRSADDPQGAVALALAEIPAGELQESVAISIVRQWGTDDPEGAGEWVESFPPSDLQERALYELGAARRGAPAE